MTPSNDLFLLIHSLSKNEKGYFKKFAQIHQAKDSNYLLLFTEIEKMEKYDEDNIKQTFATYHFIKQLPKYKNYLYQIILKSLRAFHSQATIERVLLEGLQNITILYEKGLFKQGDKLVEKLKVIASKNDKIQYLYLFIQYQSIKGIDFSRRINPDLDLVKETSILNDKLLQEQKVKKLYNALLTIYSKKEIEKNIPELKLLKKEFDSVIKEKGEPLTLSVQLDYLNATGMICRLLENHNENIAICQKVIQLFKDFPYSLQTHLENYIVAINGLIFSYRYKKNFDLAQKKLDELDHLINKKTLQIKNYIKKRTAILIINITLQNTILKGDFNVGLQYVQGLLALKKIDTKNNESLMNIYGQFFNVYFGNELYQEAGFWLDKILSSNSIKSREDLLISGRLSNLILNYELGNFRLLDSYLLSSYRLLNKKKKLHVLERIIFQFVRKSIDLDKSKRKLYYNKMKASLPQTKQDAYTQKLSKYFDFISWIESKIYDKSYQEIVQFKAISDKEFYSLKYTI